MHTVLWVLQVLLALHTAIGAVWKFSNSEQAVPSLQALPHGLWLALSVPELLCSAVLLLAMWKPFDRLAPFAAFFVTAEMLLFTVLHLASGSAEHSQMIYWLVVAALSGFIGYGRLVLRPL
jgi:hypothetical protein